MPPINSIPGSVPPAAIQHLSHRSSHLLGAVTLGNQTPFSDAVKYLSDLGASVSRLLYSSSSDPAVHLGGSLPSQSSTDFSGPTAEQKTAIDHFSRNRRDASDVQIFPVANTTQGVLTDDGGNALGVRFFENNQWKVAIVFGDGGIKEIGVSDASSSLPPDIQVAVTANNAGMLTVRDANGMRGVFFNKTTTSDLIGFPSGVLSSDLKLLGDSKCVCVYTNSTGVFLQKYDLTTNTADGDLSTITAENVSALSVTQVGSDLVSVSWTQGASDARSGRAMDLSSDHQSNPIQLFADNRAFVVDMSSTGNYVVSRDGNQLSVSSFNSTGLLTDSTALLPLPVEGATLRFFAMKDGQAVGVYTTGSGANLTAYLQEFDARSPLDGVNPKVQVLAGTVGTPRLYSFPNPNGIFLGAFSGETAIPQDFALQSVVPVGPRTSLANVTAFNQIYTNIALLENGSAMVLVRNANGGVDVRIVPVVEPTPTQEPTASTPTASTTETYTVSTPDGNTTIITVTPDSTDSTIVNITTSTTVFDTTNASSTPPTTTMTSQPPAVTFPGDAAPLNDVFTLRPDGEGGFSLTLNSLSSNAVTLNGDGSLTVLKDGITYQMIPSGPNGFTSVPEAPGYVINGDFTVNVVATTTASTSTSTTQAPNSEESSNRSGGMNIVPIVAGVGGVLLVTVGGVIFCVRRGHNRTAPRRVLELNDADVEYHPDLLETDVDDATPVSIGDRRVAFLDSPTVFGGESADQPYVDGEEMLTFSLTKGSSSPSPSPSSSSSSAIRDTRSVTVSDNPYVTALRYLDESKWAELGKLFPHLSDDLQTNLVDAILATQTHQDSLVSAVIASATRHSCIGVVSAILEVTAEDKVESVKSFFKKLADTHAKSLAKRDGYKNLFATIDRDHDFTVERVAGSGTFKCFSATLLPGGIIAAEHPGRMFQLSMVGTATDIISRDPVDLLPFHNVSGVTVILQLNQGQVGCADYVVPDGITHIKINNWKDHGAGELSLLQTTLRQVNDALEVHPGYLLIHCTAGVGRTGVVAIARQLEALHNVGQEITKGVLPLMLQARDYRSHMVQTLGQYQLLLKYVDSLNQVEDTHL